MKDDTQILASASAASDVLRRELINMLQAGADPSSLTPLMHALSELKHTANHISEPMPDPQFMAHPGSSHGMMGEEVMKRLERLEKLLQKHLSDDDLFSYAPLRGEWWQHQNQTVYEILGVTDGSLPDELFLTKLCDAIDEPSEVACEIHADRRCPTKLFVRYEDNWLGTEEVIYQDALQPVAQTKIWVRSRSNFLSPKQGQPRFRRVRGLIDARD